MTPNSIYPDDARRPLWQVADYAEIVRQVGRSLQVPVADCFRTYEMIRAVDRRAWAHLMSETIHPNFRGHKIFAEEVAWTISGRRVSLEEVPPLRPGLPRVLGRLEARQPVKIIAMPPYDRLIGPALLSLFPAATLQVTPWNPGQKNLAEIAEQAKDIGWQKYLHQKTAAADQPDLVVLAVPPDALAPDEERFNLAYSAIINAAQAMGPGGWDCLVALPSVARPGLDPAQRTAEQLAGEVVRGQDVPWLERKPNDPTDTAALLAQQLSLLLPRPQG